MQFVSKAPLAMGTCLACACNVIRLLRWTRSLIDVQTLCADCRFSRSTIPLAKRGSGARLAELGMEAPPTLRYVSIDLECGTFNKTKGCATKRGPSGLSRQTGIKHGSWLELHHVTHHCGMLRARSRMLRHDEVRSP